MVSLLSLLPTIIAFVGHVALWTWLYNRLHASGVSSERVHRLEKYLIFTMLVTMFFPAALLLKYGDHWLTHGDGLASWLGRIWAIACYGKLIHVTVAWVVNRLSNSDGGLLLFHYPDGDWSAHSAFLP